MEERDTRKQEVAELKDQLESLRYIHVDLFLVSMSVVKCLCMCVRKYVGVSVCVCVFVCVCKPVNACVYPCSDFCEYTV